MKHRPPARSRHPAPAGRSPATAWPLAGADPEAAGFSAGRLERLHALMDRTVDDGSHAGYVLLLARDGRIVDWRAHGHRDAVARRPLARDDLFRIFSMTKIVSSVAVLVLLEEGRLRLDDPVGRFLPALSFPKVLAGGTAEAPTLVPAERAVTIRHLLTHTSGFTYDDNPPPALAALWLRGNPFEAEDLDGFVARAAALPLAHQPGTAFHYGISTDLLGAVVEKASGQRLDDFLGERILEPLGLRDTGFWVPEEKRDRLALIHERGPDGRLALEGYFNGQHPTATRGLRSGGGGLFSTAADYVRFAQMLLDGGQLDGVRILGRKSVELMTADHLSGLPDPHPMGNRWQGFGLGVRVTTGLGQSPTLGSVGAFGWDGMATTTVQLDPRERLVAIALYQHLPYDEGGVFATFTNGVYAALER
jgi:CubicO group peptidase (beta-lactamase class C family)